MNNLKVLLFSFVFLSSIGTFAQSGLTINIGDDEQSHDSLTPLIQAVKANNLVLVKKLVVQGADLEETGTPFRSDDTPLDFAVKMNHQAIALFLLEKGAQSRNYLYNAILTGDLTWVKNLMAYKFDDDQAVMAAVECNNPQMVQFIVDQGFRVDFEQKQRIGIFRKRYVSPLDEAISKDNSQIVLILAKNGADLSESFVHFFRKNDVANCKNLITHLKKKQVPLEHYFLSSFYHYNLAITSLFVQNGVNKNAFTEDGLNALHISYKSGNMEAVNYCIQTLKLDPTVKTTKNQTALMLVAMSLNTNFFHQVIDSVSTIDEIDNDGNTVLYYAVETGNQVIVQEVLNKKPSINHQNKQGETVLMFLIRTKQFEMYNLLLNQERNSINFKLVSNEKVDLLGYLLAYNSPVWSTIQEYVDFGCNPKLLSATGDNLTYYLASHEMCDELKIAINWGVTIQAKDANGFAPTTANFECVKTLLENGADVNAIGTDQEVSYLNKAVELKDLTAITYLLQKGANPNSSSSNGNPYLFDFIEKEDIEMLRLFIAYNANIRWKNKANQNPLDYAIQLDRKEIIELLRAKGAKTSKEEIAYEAAIVEEIKSVIKLIEEKNTTQIKAIWAKYPDMTFDEKTYKKLYALSIEANDLELLEVLYDKKVNPNMALNFEEQNAVHLAVLQSNLDLVTLLVAKGVDPNKTDAKGNKPIFYAKSRKIKKYLSNLN
ncbi:MAG: ankyrin repeat domain-containing protein [Fluviicola sp.]